jgi:IS5 family transposase
MRTFIDFALSKEYEEVERRGDKLVKMGSLINWEVFRPILNGLYKNNTIKGGRPNIDVVIMIKLLVLQQWFGLSDPQLERDLADRISFKVFIGTSEIIPDFTTVWLFRERLAKSGKDKEIWAELQKQLDHMGYEVKVGVMQDATFITSDPGHAPKDTPRGDAAKTRRSKDGTWAKKGQKSQFGYKLHSKIDKDYGLIREIETTTASLHDSQVDLAREGEVRYTDKAYSGAKTKGYDASMKRAARDHPLGIMDILRNRRISKTRSPVERHYAVIKRVFKAGHVMVTTVKRTAVKMTFTAIGFNLYHLLTLKNKNAV